jgi:hypothetical protein
MDVSKDSENNTNTSESSKLQASQECSQKQRKSRSSSKHEKEGQEKDTPFRSSDKSLEKSSIKEEKHKTESSSLKSTSSCTKNFPGESIEEFQFPFMGESEDNEKVTKQTKSLESFVHESYFSTDLKSLALLSTQFDLQHKHQ